MTAQEIVAKLTELPPVSQSALKLLSLLGDPQLDNDEVVRTLKYDNALTARLLRACNSSLFGFEETVASVDQAVLILGYEKILQIVLTLAFGEAMGVPVEAYAFEAEDLWRHSLMTAAAAEMLVQTDTLPQMDRSAAYTAGLLHDIGKLAINQVLEPDQLASFRHLLADHRLPRVEAEKKVIGADHAEVGAFLLYSWCLPHNIVEAVANHHQPVLDPFPQLSAATCLANSIAHLASTDLASAGYTLRMDSQLAQSLGLTDEKGERLVAEVHESLEEVEHFMALA